MFHNTGGMEGVELIKLKAASTYRMHPVSRLKENMSDCKGSFPFSIRPGMPDAIQKAMLEIAFGEH